MLREMKGCKFYFTVTTLLLFIAIAFAQEVNMEHKENEHHSTNRLRVIMTSDFPPIGVVKGGNLPNDQKSDPDDMQSIVRFLLYANEFDIEALIASAGTFANIAKKQNILDVIDHYETVYENLKKHDPVLPSEI